MFSRVSAGMVVKVRGSVVMRTKLGSVEMLTSTDWIGLGGYAEENFVTDVELRLRDSIAVAADFVEEAPAGAIGADGAPDRFHEAAISG